MMSIRNVVLTVRTADAPRVPDNEQVQIEPLGDAFWRVTMTFGYMEAPNIPRGLALLRKLGFKQEGVWREREYMFGRFVDLWLFGLLRHEWENT